MAQITLRNKTEDIIKHCLTIASDITHLPSQQIWIDYDRDADTLYLSFRKPQRAKQTVETDDDILIRKDGKKIVGLTILHASTR